MMMDSRSHKKYLKFVDASPICVITTREYLIAIHAYNNNCKPSFGSLVIGSSESDKLESQKIIIHKSDLVN